MTRQSINQLNAQFDAERLKITPADTVRMGNAFRRGRAAARKIDVTDASSYYRLLFSRQYTRVGWRAVETAMWCAGVEFEAGLRGNKVALQNAFKRLRAARHILGRAIAIGRA